jgi:hypothetical protein
MRTLPDAAPVPSIGMGAPEIYDQYATKANWDRSERLHRWNARRLLQHLAATTGLDPAASTLLEVGTGTGRVASAASAWRRYEGVEPTNALRQMTRERYGVTVHDASLPNLPAELKGFDAAIAIHVLEHAPDGYAARAWLAAMCGAVRPGGFVLIASPDLRDYRTSFWESDWSHGWPTTPHRIADLMIDVGLTPIVVRSMRLGSLSPWNVAGHVAGGLIPTRPVDALTRRYVGRPLATGVKIATLWGLAFVVGQAGAESG